MRNKNGYYVSENGIIYVQGTVDGKYYRKSTFKKATKDNIRWAKKHCYEDLLKLISKKDITKTTSLEEFGKMIIENSANKRSAAQQRDTLGKFNNHILPTFQNFSLEDIKVSDVEHWQNKLLEKLSTSSVKKCREILSLIFKKAVADDLVVKNYVELADNIRVVTKKRIPYTEHELRLIIEHSYEWFHIYLVLVASSGLRLGEAIGLQWDDIDLNNGFIDLKRSISKGVIVDETSLTNKTKNHQRIIPLDRATVRVLAQYHMKRPDSFWVFVNKYDEPFYDAANINRHHWKPLLAELNIKDKTMYALRHSWVSVMKNNGVSDSWLKAVGGWKQSSKVMDDMYYTFNEQKLIQSSNNYFHYIEDEKASIV